MVGKTRNFFACSVCEPGEDYCEENLRRITSHNGFVLHDTTPQKGTFEDIAPGDILLLKYNRHFIAYGEVVEKKIGGHPGEDAHWDHWAYVKKWNYFDDSNKGSGITIYGIGWATIGGGAYGTVKTLKNEFSIGKIKEINDKTDLYLELQMESKDLKNRFMDWFININGGDQSYFTNQFGGDRERLSAALDKYASYFLPRNIFNITSTIYKVEIPWIENEVYNNKAFLDYSEGINRHMPRAILGKQNYLKFLSEEFEGGTGLTEGENDTEIKFPKNIILYGPPGTGKTFNTINKALEVIAPKFYEENRNNRLELTKHFRKLLFNYDTDEGQIGFITFHQSMSYEDFIEGIKPLPPDDINDTFYYDVVPGLFKRLCNAAQSNEGSFNEKIEWLKNECSEFENKPAITITTKRTTFSFSYRGGKTFRIKPSSSPNPEADYPASIENIRKIYEGGLRKEVYNPTYVVEILNYLYKNGLDKYSPKNNASGKPFVLIIDEINRGNVSQIFGELITLIEEDKRIGKDEALEVTLPYSKEKFGVPQNLYIIGTMNTADRSVEALDTALRRRFSFVEMQSKPSLIKTDGKLKDKGGVVEGINLVLVLEIINKRIEKLLDKDHLIGHSYFMSVTNLESLKCVFQNNINPLLQEYFFGDFGKIGLVIGSGFFENGGAQEKEDDNLFADFVGCEGTDLSERAVFRLQNVSEMTNEAFITAMDKLLKK